MGFVSKCEAEMWWQELHELQSKTKVVLKFELIVSSEILQFLFENRLAPLMTRYSEIAMADKDKTIVQMGVLFS